MNSYNVIDRDGILVSREYDPMRKCIHVRGYDCRTEKRADWMLDARFDFKALAAGRAGGTTLPKKDQIVAAAERIFDELVSARHRMFSKFAFFLRQPRELLPMLGSHAAEAVMYYDWLLPSDAAAIGIPDLDELEKRSRKWQQHASWLWANLDKDYARYSMTARLKFIERPYEKFEFVCVKGVLLDLASALRHVKCSQLRWAERYGRPPRAAVLDVYGDVVGFAAF